MLVIGEYGIPITLILTVYCLVDIITCEDRKPHGLFKAVWALIVIFLLPPVGSIVWLVARRRARVGAGPKPAAYERARPDYPEYDRPGRFAAPDPEADAEFLRRCRERAEQQRRKAAGDHPGRGSTPPGDGSVPPGGEATPPGDGSVPPGGEATPPGDGSVPPGGEPPRP